MAATAAILGGIQIANLLIPVVGNIISLIVHKADGTTTTTIIIAESDAQFDKVIATGQAWLAANLPAAQPTAQPAAQQQTVGTVPAAPVSATLKAT